MAKKVQAAPQVEPAQGCEYILDIEGVPFACDNKNKKHTDPHGAKRVIGDTKSPDGYHVVYIITWKRVPNFLSS